MVIETELELQWLDLFKGLGWDEETLASEASSLLA